MIADFLRDGKRIIQTQGLGYILKFIYKIVVYRNWLYRGSRKDFIDIYYLLDRFSLEDILGFYDQKYKDGSTFLVLKSLNYFDDADSEEMPHTFENISWDNVKSRVSQAHKEYILNGDG